MVEPNFTPPEVTRVERYRAQTGTLWLTIVATEIGGYAELREPMRTNTQQPFADIITDFVEKRFGGVLISRGSHWAWHAYAEPMSAVLAAMYLHTHVASAPLGGYPARLRSGIDLGSVAPPRHPLSPVELLQLAHRATQTMQYAKRGSVMVTEDTHRRLAGRLGVVVQLVRPEKRAITVDGSESRINLYTAEAPKLPETPPRLFFPHAQISLRVHDEGEVQEHTFDADVHGNVVFGTYHTCNVLLKTPGIRPHHCRILLDESGNWVLDDLDEPGGTFLNGVEVRYGALLSVGNVIQIGDAHMEVTGLVTYPKM